MSKHIPWGMHNSGSELTISNTKSNGDIPTPASYEETKNLTDFFLLLL